MAEILSWRIAQRRRRHRAAVLKASVFLLLAVGVAMLTLVIVRSI